MKMYYWSKYDGKIQEREVIRRTPKFVIWMHDVWGKERRETIESGYHKWFDTVEEAEVHEQNFAMNKVQACKDALIRAENRLSTITARRAS